MPLVPVDATEETIQAAAMDAISGTGDIYATLAFC